MHRHTTSFGMILLLLGAAASSAEEVKPVEGTFLIGGQTYKLAHIAAYESKLRGDTVITILVSDRKLPLDKLKSALAAGEGSDDGLSLKQPHLKIVFDESGKLSQTSGGAEGSMFNTSSDLTGELQRSDGRVQGEARLAAKGEGQFQRSYDVRFNVGLGVDAAPRPVVAKRTGPVKPSVAGTFKGNGKPAKLAFVSARPAEPFGGESAIMLIFTEKDHSKDPRADFKAGFGDYGSALVISLHEDGSIFSCQVAHAALGRPFSSSGTIKTSEFDVGDGEVSGQITTGGPDKVFDDTWEVDIKFTAPFTAPAPKAVAVAPPPAKKAGDKPAAKKSRPVAPDQPAKSGPATKPAQPAGEKLNVHDLSLPKDVGDFQYKTLVQHLSFKSGTDVQPFVAELSKSLAAQGWKEKGRDLVTPKSAILNRTRGEATLTIFVKPAAKGSEVTVMSSGLDWSEKAEKEE